MNLRKLLDEFYLKNNIPNEGGEDETTFVFKVFGINLNLPNPKFRREALHIHDLQHVLNNCDTSWKGESFIAGWEISTGMWKYFPLGLLSLWAMGYGLWIFPKEVYLGYKKGLNCNGIIDLNLKKSDFLEMNFHQLVSLTKKVKETPFGIFEHLKFFFWILISQVILLLPIILISILIVLFL